MPITDYLALAVDRRASDLHLVGGSVPTLRVDGDLVRISNEPLADEVLRQELVQLVHPDILKQFEENREVDFAQQFPQGRFRLNLHYQEGRMALAARVIAAAIPRPDELGFSETIYGLTHLHDGLVLVTGPSGSGKSTTLAAMVDIINTERQSHIITIEDPIEYHFTEKQSIIEQRELGYDTQTYAKAIKHALRQDPNVIMVGEMRDLETITAVLTAAETGHLVFSTLHTGSAPETIKRISSVFPAHQQQLIRYQLSGTLRGVISQQLLPRIGGGRVAAREIMITNSGIANLISENKVEQLYSAIQTGHQEGMVTMNRSIDELYARGLITEQVAKNRKIDPEKLTRFY